LNAKVSEVSCAPSDKIACTAAPVLFSGFFRERGGGGNIFKLPPASVESMQSLMGGKPQPFVLQKPAAASSNPKGCSHSAPASDSFAVALENLISHGEISREIVKYFTLSPFTPIFMRA
jgi:hypothetical protein